MTRRKRSGRKPTRPTDDHLLSLSDLDLWVDLDLKSILRKCACPEKWTIGDAAFLLLDFAHWYEVPKDLAECARLTELLTDDPDAFLRLFAELRSRVQAIASGSIFNAALQILWISQKALLRPLWKSESGMEQKMIDWIWGASSDEIAGWIRKISKRHVTAKNVEHARANIRNAKPILRKLSHTKSFEAIPHEDGLSVGKWVIPRQKSIFLGN